MTVNAAKNYTLTGAGRIAGEAVLNKSGSGTLTLYQAPTPTPAAPLISGGTLAISNAAALGTGHRHSSAGGTWCARHTDSQPASVIVSATANSTITGRPIQWQSRNQSHHRKRRPHLFTPPTSSIWKAASPALPAPSFSPAAASFRLFGSAGSSAAAFDLGHTARRAPARARRHRSDRSPEAAGSSLGGANGYNSAVTYTLGANNPHHLRRRHRQR